MTEYYRLIAVLEAQQLQLTAWVEGGGAVGGVSSRSTLSLRRLAVWTHNPLHRLKVLSILVDGCKRERLFNKCTS